MKLLLNSLPALTGKLPAWFTSNNSYHWSPVNSQAVPGTNIYRHTSLEEKCGLFQKRHNSSCSGKLSNWSWHWPQSCKHKGKFFRSNYNLGCLPFSTLIGEVDRHQGLWVDLSKPGKDGFTYDQISEEKFDVLLKDSLKIWKNQGVTSAWLHVKMSQGKLIPVASKYGFTFHHAEGNRATLALWLGEGQESKIPQFATHQLGVSGVVIKEDTGEVLVVQDKNRPFQLWKFPGGLSDLGEDIATTAEREVFEETGLRTEFQSVLAFRQHHHLPGAFGRSDFYVLCRLKPLTFDLRPCEEEIEACKWMPVEQLKCEVPTSPMIQTVADIVLLGLKNGFKCQEKYKVLVLARLVASTTAN